MSGLREMGEAGPSRQSESQGILERVGWNPDSLHSTHGVEGWAESGKGQSLPNSNELLSLLQKQDTVISDLFGELEVCKGEMGRLKEENKKENKKMIEEVKSLIITHSPMSTPRFEDGNENETQKLDSNENNQETLIISSSITPRKEGRNSQGVCSNCQKLKRLVDNLQKWKEETLLPGSVRETEAVEKVKKAIRLTEERGKESGELRLRLSHTQEQLTQAEDTLTQLRHSHKTQMEDSRQSVAEEYQTEINTTKQENQRKTSEINALKAKVESLTTACQEMEEEHKLLKENMNLKENELLKDLSDLRREVSDEKVERRKLEDMNKDLDYRLEQETQLHSQKVDMLEERCEELRRVGEETRTEGRETKEQLLHALQHNSLLQTQLRESKEEARGLSFGLEEERNHSILKLETLNRSAFEDELRSRSELEILVETQKSLIGKLKLECGHLAEEMDRRGRIQREELKKLKKEKQEILIRLEKALESSDS